MASTINGTSTGNGGLISTGDDSGILNIQTNETTAISIDASQNVGFNSGYGSVATAYGCRAWATFVGSSGAISGSGNCSSITRNGTGDYTFNFSTALTDANYAIIGTCKPTSAQTNTLLSRTFTVYYNGTPSTTAFRFITVTGGIGVEDFDKNYVAVFR